MIEKLGEDGLAPPLEPKEVSRSVEEAYSLEKGATAEATPRIDTMGPAVDRTVAFGGSPDRAPVSNPPGVESAELVREDAAKSQGDLLPIDPAELRGAVEAVLFSVSEPMPIRSIAEVLGATLHEVRAVVEDLRLEYIDLQRAFRIEDIAGGIQLLTLARFDPWIRRLRQKEKEGRLTPAALETLAVIAYKQPISKADLEGVRGVGCGPTLKTLLERGLIQISGRGEGLGRPLLYGTTKRFLESFGISSTRELPQPELMDRPPGLELPPGVLPLVPPQAPMEGAELPEGSVPDAPERGEQEAAEPVAPGNDADAVDASAEPSLSDADGPLS